jgi:hypothetical protein
MEESIEVLDSIDDDCKKPTHGRSNEQMILSNPADLNQSSRLWGRDPSQTPWRNEHRSRKLESSTACDRIGCISLG